MSNRPGGNLARRPLHFIWIADCSNSMAGEKIQSLNFAIRSVLPHMCNAADENPNAEIFVRAIRFAKGAQWVTPTPTLVREFHWTDLQTGGFENMGTDLGKAMLLLADQMKIPPMNDRALPPVLVLLTDGQPTDDYNTGLNALFAQPWGRRAVRIAIAIGHDADQTILQKFIGAQSELRPLLATNAEQLINFIKWASTAVLDSVARPASVPFAAASADVNPPVSAPAGTLPPAVPPIGAAPPVAPPLVANIPIPAPPTNRDPDPNSATDMW